MGQRYNKKAKTDGCTFQKVGGAGWIMKVWDKQKAARKFTCRISLQPLGFKDTSVPEGNQTSLMISIPILMASSFIGIKWW